MCVCDGGKRIDGIEGARCVCGHRRGASVTSSVCAPHERGVRDWFTGESAHTGESAQAKDHNHRKNARGERLPHRGECMVCTGLL